MTLPTFAAALGPSTPPPMPSAADAALGDGNGLPAGEAKGDFAALLDDASSGLDVLAALASDAGMTALADGLPGAASLVPPAAPTLPDPAAADAGDAVADGAGRAPGWPPPGLSSLFPATPVLVAQAGAPAAATTLASVRGVLGGLWSDASSAPATNGGNAGPATVPSSTTAASATPAPNAVPSPAANALAPDVLAAALARQPAPLRLPVADDSDTTGLTAITEALGIERAPDLAPTTLPAPTPTPHKLDLAQAFPAPVPLPSPRFAEDVGARLQWIAEQQGGEATLRISPDGLGPVEIRMKLDGDRVDLGFAATQQDTRQALQDALPKLREMLAQQGLQLGQTDVGQKHAHASNDEAAKTAKGFAGEDEGEGIVLAPQPREATLVIGRAGRGVLDLYA